MRKNERKIQALEMLKEAWRGKHVGKIMIWGYTRSALRVAQQLGISRNSASNLLRRMWKQGLVRRKRMKNGIEYWITSKGLKRLSFLKRERTKQKLKRNLGKMAFWKG